MPNIEIAQADEVIITTLEELGPAEPTTDQIMRFDAAMSEDTQGLGHSLLKEVSDIQKSFKTVKMTYTLSWLFQLIIPTT